MSIVARKSPKIPPFLIIKTIPYYLCPICPIAGIINIWWGWWWGWNRGESWISNQATNHPAALIFCRRTRSAKLIWKYLCWKNVYNNAGLYPIYSHWIYLHIYWASKVYWYFDQSQWCHSCVKSWLCSLLWKESGEIIVKKEEETPQQVFRPACSQLLVGFSFITSLLFYLDSRKSRKAWT